MKIISLFSGAGGMDLGLLYSGHNIVYSNDFDKDAYNSYALNIKKYAPHNSDLGDIKGVIDNINNSNSSLKNIDADIIIGGFPCQGFSIANINRSMEDSRNHLYLQILRLLEIKNPKYFMLENVKGLENMEKGKILQLILKDLGSVNNGYDIIYDVINSIDYGVPQSRERIIIFGVRKDINIEKHVINNETSKRSNFIISTLNYQENQDTNQYIDLINTFYYDFTSYKTPVEIDLNNFIFNKTTLRDTISDLPKNFDDNYLIQNHNGSKCKVHPKSSEKSKRVGNRPTNWDLHSPTIMGRGSGTGGPLIIPHPDHHRRLSVREVARIQSFPDNFIFTGSKSSQYRQIGNAVPVLMAYHLGLFLRNIEG